jgi:dipeptidyl aminopeptidase/acylaminoacyl peptidase
MAVPLDVRRRRVTGPPVPVLGRVAVEQGNNGNSDIYVSSGGAMVTGRQSSHRRLVWVSADGRSRPALPDEREYDWVALSPDGSRIAAVVSDDHGSDVWIYDTRLSTFSRLTALGTAVRVEWSPDGSRVVFVAQDSAARNAVWSESAAGGSTPRELFADPALMGHADMSPDGMSLLFQLFRASWDLMRLPLDAADSTSVARPYVDTPFQERYPRFSPDGKWVAYTSDETGQLEVYVRSFPDPSTKVQVSVGGGDAPRWSPDGSRLYYVTGSRPATLLAAHVALTPAFRLLGRDTVAPIDAIDPTLGYGVSRDGKSVLGVASGSGGLQLVVAPNWITELRRRLAAAGAPGGGTR